MTEYALFFSLITAAIVTVVNAPGTRLSRAVSNTLQQSRH